MRLRLVSRLIVVSLVVVVGVVMLLRGRVWGVESAPQLQGTGLGSVPAADFTLPDQDGTSMTLSALHGQPVVLTFMYTHCPDACASKVQQAAAALGDRAADVHWLAVSVDPTGDTPADARTFVANSGMGGRLHFLLGTQAQLQPVWDAYHVSVAPGQSTPGTGATVVYTDGVYVLDSQGRERVYLGADDDSHALASDLQALLQS